MLNKLTNLAAALSVVLLLGGYLASQYAAMTGSFADYAQKTDSAPIRALALILLVGAIGVALYRGKKGI